MDFGKKVQTVFSCENESKKAIFTYMWEIEKFNLLQNLDASSPEFKLSIPDGEVKFEMSFHPTDHQSNKFASCFLKRREDQTGIEHLTIDFSLTLSTELGSKSCNIEHNFSINNGRGCMDLNNLNILKQGSWFLSSYPVTVQCQIWSITPSASTKRDIELIEVIKRRIICIFPSMSKYKLPDSMWIFLDNKVNQLKSKIVPHLTAQVVRTTVVGERVSTTIKLPSFSSLKLNNPVFHVVVSQLTQVPVMTIEIYLDNSDMLCFTTHPCEVEKDESMFLVIAKISVLDKNGNATKIVKEHVREFKWKNGPWSFPPFTKRDILVAEKDNYLPGDILSILGEFAFTTGKWNTILEETTQVQDESSEILKCNL